MVNSLSGAQGDANRNHVKKGTNSPPSFPVNFNVPVGSSHQSRASTSSWSLQRRNERSNSIKDCVTGFINLNQAETLPNQMNETTINSNKNASDQKRKMARFAATNSNENASDQKRKMVRFEATNSNTDGPSLNNQESPSCSSTDSELAQINKAVDSPKLYLELDEEILQFTNKLSEIQISACNKPAALHSKTGQKNQSDVSGQNNCTSPSTRPNSPNEELQTN